jgi:hypothetical protein
MHCSAGGIQEHTDGEMVDEAVHGEDWMLRKSYFLQRRCEDWFFKIVRIVLTSHFPLLSIVKKASRKSHVSEKRVSNQVRIHCHVEIVRVKEVFYHTSLFF